MVGALGILGIYSEPICVKRACRCFQLSLQSRSRRWLTEINFALNVIGGLVVLSPQTVKWNILNIVLKCLAPESLSLVNIEPVNVHALVHALQSNQVAIVLTSGVD